ncbi:MAG: hypothetical protein Q4D76_16710 [Oscillospiraceae bacterium]|nr:hypothetical protein [Oscillospiraceae bacterium]
MDVLWNDGAIAVQSGKKIFLILSDEGKIKPLLEVVVSDFSVSVEYHDNISEKEGLMENTRIHQIKVDFNVTPEILRYVYVYIIEAKHCYLIDSGVSGCEKQILNYLTGIGRSAEDVKGIMPLLFWIRGRTCLL